MRFRTWPVAALGFGGLLALIIVSMLASSRRAEEIYSQLDQLNTYHHNVDAKLRGLRSDVHLSGILIRDYLLDRTSAGQAAYGEQLSGLRRTSKATLSELRFVAERHDNQIRSLETQLDEYWRAHSPIFEWTPAEKMSRSADFLRREVVPRRMAVMNLAYEIERLNEANLVAERSEITERYAAFRQDLHRLLWQSVLLGLSVALVSVLRLRSLEKRSEQQRSTAQEAERQMRQLSQRLVEAQEEERRNLSRELHDDVAQVLTALRMEIGRIDRAKTPGDARIGAAAVECRKLVDRMFGTVRDLALGLRPSMLDDLGLEPALEWHVRDFTARFGLNVQLAADGDLDGLPERHRTCVYRIVQEALTNCVRHASATNAMVDVAVRANGLELSVADNGVGLDPSRRRDGLGLRGIEERVKELGGEMVVESEPGSGTKLSIHLPLPADMGEERLARATG